MVDPKYKEIGTPVIKMIEECSELIYELCKVDRFGWYGWHPDDPDKKLNIERVVDELADLNAATVELLHHISSLGYKKENGNKDEKGD